MSGVEQPSRDELLALMASQARVIEELTARVAAQDGRIAELERQVGRNSRNSSQPPSTDGPAVSPSRAERRRSRPAPGEAARRGRVGVVPVKPGRYRPPDKILAFLESL